MYRKKHSICRAWYYPWFQVSTSVGGVLDHLLIGEGVSECFGGLVVPLIRNVVGEGSTSCTSFKFPSSVKNRLKMF